MPTSPLIPILCYGAAQQRLTALLRAVLRIPAALFVMRLSFFGVHPTLLPMRRPLKSSTVGPGVVASSTLVADRLAGKRSEMNARHSAGIIRNFPGINRNFTVRAA